MTALEAIESTRALTTAEALEAMEIAWPGCLSSLGAAQPIPQRGHAPSTHGEINPTWGWVLDIRQTSSET